MSAEIGWRCCALNFECDHRHLVDDSLINRQPVQAVQQRLGIGSSWHLEHDSSCVVLHTLKFLDGAGWNTVQKSVIVVDSRENQTTSQRLCKFRCQEMSYPICDGWLERGSCTTLQPLWRASRTSKMTPSTFICSDTGRLTPATVRDGTAGSTCFSMGHINSAGKKVFNALQPTYLKLYSLRFESNIKQYKTDFPLLIILRVLAISTNEGLSDGSSAQHCFIRVKMPGCTAADSSWGSAGR